MFSLSILYLYKRHYIQVQNTHNMSVCLFINTPSICPSDCPSICPSFCQYFRPLSHNLITRPSSHSGNSRFYSCRHTSTASPLTLIRVAHRCCTTPPSPTLIHHFLSSCHFRSLPAHAQMVDMVVTFGLHLGKTGVK